MNKDFKRIVIGTAGHIDHGKTTLVKALTGRDTDRLKEEKMRGISIELGFAPFVLPGGQKAAIVDVPGHERFIRHMLAGAFGIDFVLLVIAADEGVMPQTREHLDIIQLLGIRKGIVVLTKKDMVDEDWLMLVEEEVKDYLAGTVLAGAPIIAVSAVTGEGIPALMETIGHLAEEIEERPAFGYARLPIDRVFTMPGFGTVVTGTLWSGKILTGESLELLPAGKTVRVRTLQVHGEKVEEAVAGQRVAVNLQGIEMSEVKRGFLLASKGSLTPGYRVDAKIHLLPTSPFRLKNWNRVRFHLGTDETMGRVVLLDRDELLPGEEGFVQIAMEKPVVAAKNDLFVLRYYSPVHTIGGGTILEPNAPRQKRFREEVLHELAIKEEGSRYDIVLHVLENEAERIFTLEELEKKSSVHMEELKEELRQLLEDEKVCDLDGKGSQYISAAGLSLLAERMTGILAEYHHKYPLRAGYSKEDMRSRFLKDVNAKHFNSLLKLVEKEAGIASQGGYLSLPGFRPEPDAATAAVVGEIMERLEKAPFTPPSPDEIKAELGLTDSAAAEIFGYLFDQGLVIKAAEGVVFAASAVEDARQRICAYFANEKELALGPARDLLDSSRKYILPLLEYFDRTRFTKRMGDARILMKT